MSTERPITRDNLNEYLKALAKEFRRLNGTKTPAEIVLIGGAAVLAGYGFRELTYDVDAVIIASSAMKEAINIVGDRLDLPRGWLNDNFTRTESYTDKLLEVSVYYRTFSNVLQVRTVTAEYLVAMKLMSGRRYKNDISDVYGILWEHQKNGAPMSKAAVEQAIAALYGGVAKLPEKSALLLEKAFADSDFARLYSQSRKDEKEAKNLLIEFEEQYPHALKTENIDSVLEQLKRKRDEQKH
ncbi:MAG: hypothetical protein LBC46_00555 [Treponema sp.]|jgi:hypothetical protein|nr:hypothetical protein [Treponema sp.]